MSVLANELKRKLDSERELAAQAWKALSEYREQHGDAEIAKSAEMFAETNRLHGVYGEAKDNALNTEKMYFSALAMDGETAPSLKDVGEEAGVKTMRSEDVTKAVRGVMSLVEKAMDRVEDSDAYKAYLGNKTAQGGAQVGTLLALEDVVDRAEMKSLMTKTLLTGAIDGQPVFLLPDLQQGIVEGFARIANNIVGLCTVGTTDNDTVDWIQENQPTWNAAETPEAVNADKTAGDASSTAPESAVTFTREETTVKEIKHYIPATKRALADIGQLRTIADQELLYGLDKRLNGQVMNGDGTGENLTGILNTSGILTQARGTDPQVEALHKAFTQLLLQGYDNVTVAIHPSDWETIRLAKDANGQYYYGPPALAGTQTIWGRPVVLTQHLTAGTAVAADFKRSCTVWLRAGASIVATDSHSDWFLKGIIAILASMRAAFAVVRPKGVCEVTGL